MSLRPLGSSSPFQRTSLEKDLDLPKPKAAPDDAPVIGGGWKPRAGGAAPRRIQYPQEVKPPRLDEVAEREILEGVRKPGKLVSLAEGDASQPLALTIHGINGDPEDVQPFIDDAARAGQTTLTFCYDDQYRRLTQSSKELATQLGSYIDENPNRPLEISAHSMGSRVVLAALEQLRDEGRLNMPVELRMVAPPLGGYGSANLARLAPRFIGERIAGVQPGKDMGTWSRFQHDLEALKLPENVRVTVFTGTNDEVVDAKSEGFRRIVENLDAREVILPGADHMGTVEGAARWLRDNPR